jgi:prolyl-tRNA synthetase
MVHIVATGKEDLPFTTAEKIALDLESKGVTVMLDDRKEASPGVKFKDAELIGNPVIVIVGKALAEGKVELRIRSVGTKSEVPLANVTSEVLAALK